jgi:hypothetical protein
MKTLVGMAALIVVMIGSASVLRTPSAAPGMQDDEIAGSQSEMPAYIYLDADDWR